MRGTVAGLAALALTIASGIVPLAAPASAAGFAVADNLATLDDAAPTELYVAATGDDASANPCTTFDTACLTVSGAVTRAQTAIADGAIDVTVHIAAGTYTENVTIGSVASGHSVSLVGAAASSTIIHGVGDASAPASVINIASGTVNITGLSITGGYAVSGGGIFNQSGTLTVSDSAVSDNTATGDDASEGGGIFNDTGVLSVSDSTVSDNTVISTDKLAGGGGIYNNAGTATVSGSTVSDNTAPMGYAGGIYNYTGVLSVTSSTVSGNSGWYVGGIQNRATLTVSDSTVSGNIATKNFGGGISNFGGTLELSDSTLSGNTATNLNLGNGGAIYNKGYATITNATLSDNSAYQGGGIWSNKGLVVTNSTLSDNVATDRGGGIYRGGSSAASISNSILSGSSCNMAFIVDQPAWNDGGYNVSDDSSCFPASGTTSINGSSTIGLAPLAANGSTGPWTMAIDATSSAHHLVPACTGTDERGLERPGFGGTANCDAGAYELQAVAPTVTTDPQSQTFAIGTDATFTAEASGTPTPTVTWQVDTGSGWADVAGATETTLTVASVTRAMDGYQYRAVFTNGAAPDATTAVATLTVPLGALDHLVVAPAEATFVAGGSQAFTAEGFDAYGNDLGDVTDATVFAGSAGLVCTAGSCTASAAGTYTVTATDGSATGTASVTVTAVPVVHPPVDKSHVPVPPHHVPVPPHSGAGTDPGDVPAQKTPASSKPAKPKVAKTRRVVRGASARIRVRVAKAGRIRISGPRILRRHRIAKKAGAYHLSVRLSKRARRMLVRRGWVKVRVNVRWTSPKGRRTSTRIWVTFKRRASAKHHRRSSSRHGDRRSAARVVKGGSAVGAMGRA